MILSDLVAVALIISVVTGVFVWSRRVRRRRRLAGARGTTRWIRANRWFHLVGGLIASTYLIVMSVTGLLVNHKEPLGSVEDPCGCLTGTGPQLAVAVSPTEPSLVTGSSTRAAPRSRAGHAAAAGRMAPHQRFSRVREGR